MTVQQPPTVVTVTFADSGVVSGAFYMGDFFGGIIIAPASGWAAGNIGFQVCATETGTFAILRDDATDAPIQIANVNTSSLRAYNIPTKVFPATWAKLWSKSATAATETDVSQTGGPLSFTIILK